MNDDYMSLAEICADVQRASECAQARAPQPVDAMRAVLCAMEDALDFVDDYVDVKDGDYGQPEPNRAMMVARVLRDAIASLEGKA